MGFTIPVPGSVWAVAAVLALIVAAVLVLLVLPVVLLRIEVTEDKLVVSAPPLYRFSASRASVAEVSVVNLNERNDLTPALRLYGHGLPGYRLGWFKLKNGSKAFLAVSAGDAVVFRLDNRDYLIVTPVDLEGFINALRGLGWPAPT